MTMISGSWRRVKPLMVHVQKEHWERHFGNNPIRQRLIKSRLKYKRKRIIVLTIICLWIEIGFYGKEITIRMCHGNSIRKVDTCGETEIMGHKTTFCYCGTDACNGTNQVHPVSQTALLTIFGALILVAKFQF